MSMRLLFLAGILLLLPRGPILAAPGEQAGGAESAEYYDKAIAATKDTREQALLYKRLGDLYVSHEDYGKAADEFLQALSLASSAFSEQDRLGMAITISWAGRYDDAVTILRSILAEDPKNRDARIHLAQILSWASKLDEAGKEAEEVLKQYPENQDALLVKANVLRWRGEARASIPVYEKALAQSDNFDVQIGLAYAYLDIGDKEKATEISRTLKPQYASQNKELASFRDALCRVRASHIGIGYSYYQDSDGNTVNRSGLLYGFWSGNWESELAYWVIEAKDLRHEWAETISITTHRREGRLGVGAGAGINSTAGGTRNDLVGQGNADISIGWWSFGVNASREVLSDTAELIQNRIRRTAGTLSVSQTASSRLTFSESYSHAVYSDSNDADDLQASARYAVMQAPLKAAVGYRYRYWDFRRQSGSGYFDPDNFNSHQVFVSLSAEHKGFHASLEPYTGYQSFNRYGERSADFFAGYSASVGWNMTKCAVLELNGEGGNYAGGSTAGFNYYMVGFKLIVNF
jgi:tetratricopeptide (TPR) repeat protein